jgi:hypothetical protein
MPNLGSRLHSIFRISALLGVCVLAAVETSSAAPASGPTVTYEFVGQCTDCTGTGVGYLTLQGYTLGNSLNCSYFVGFTYSSNLINLNITQCSTLTGTLGPTLPGSAAVNLANSSNTGLISLINGNWFAGNIPLPPDIGTGGTWSIPSSVPTLGTAALCALGLLLAVAGALLARSRRTARV